MDITRALSFPFDDDDWIVKFVVGSLMSLAGVFLPFILLGYQVNVARNVFRGKRRPLPGWDNVGEVVADGLMAFIAGLVYAIPGIVIGCVLAFSGGLLGNSSLGGTLFLCLSCCLGTFLILYGIVAAALYWMGMIRYAETGNFSEFMQFRDLWEDARSNIGTLLSLLIYSLVLGLLAAVLLPFSLILCGVGELIVIFYAQIVSGHLIGQAGLEIAHGY
jgi:hypothetical protein